MERTADRDAQPPVFQMKDVADCCNAQIALLGRSPDAIGAGVMQPFNGITAELIEPQDWHACGIM
ncbi:hypothetical protein ACNJX9_29200 [Bradyrhizobium sp. DASA03076]|jgi:hypothetical protein|uniref:hypothetical protein n=1 Tax=Bradyrhizobium TaxID=374 RepID=UPI0012EDC938|nr:hypothetical protein [Bradyrhizobium manausense]